MKGAESYTRIGVALSDSRRLTSMPWTDLVQAIHWFWLSEPGQTWHHRTHTAITAALAVRRLRARVVAVESDVQE